FLWKSFFFQLFNHLCQFFNVRETFHNLQRNVITNLMRLPKRMGSLQKFFQNPTHHKVQRQVNHCHPTTEDHSRVVQQTLRVQEHHASSMQSACRKNMDASLDLLFWFSSFITVTSQ